MSHKEAQKTQRGLVNDCLRILISWAIRALGMVGNRILKLRLVRFGRTQEQLKQRYGIARETPVTQSIQLAAIKAGGDAMFAKTSGSTGNAKEVLYTRRRLRFLKLTFSDMFARACYAFSIHRTSLYVFSSFKKDESLTSLLLSESRLPNYLSTLQAPYRVQHHPAIQALVARYSSTAVRLWILAISNPGVLYSTNPSTISTFLDSLANDWLRSSKLIRDWTDKRATFSLDVHQIARRSDSRDCEQRLKRIATSNSPLPLSVCAPAIEAYICWTGGYVKPFLDRLAAYLPAPRYKLIPMYSMSTETIETLPRFHDEDVAFFPIADGVVYEFIEEQTMDHADNLLDAHQLEPGKLYAMVISDGYGLRRYQTDDLFLCRRKIDGLPDLVFVRRRSLQYSFTGEKLTAEQLSLAFDQLRVLYPALLADKFLTCVPSQSSHALPHYTVLLVGDVRGAASYDVLAVRCDEMLCEINCEYRSKRATGRLGAVRIMELRIEEFSEQTQFKFLPLNLHHLLGRHVAARRDIFNTGSHGVPPLQMMQERL